MFKANSSHHHALSPSESYELHNVQKSTLDILGNTRAYASRKSVARIELSSWKFVTLEAKLLILPQNTFQN
jgi:hypothetical protein